MAKKSKQNATTGQKVADRLARLSPKSLLTMFKKNAGLQLLPVGNGSTVSASLCHTVAAKNLSSCCTLKSFVVISWRQSREARLFAHVVCSSWCEARC